MTVASICKREIVTLDAGASLRDAALAMRAEHVGSLVVTQLIGGAEQAIGVVTDRDLVVDALALDLDPHRTNIGQLAKRHLSAVPGNASLGEAVEIMREAGVRRLLVTEGDGRIVGIVSFDDVLEALAGQISGLAGAVRSGIAREGVERPAAPKSHPVFLAHGTPGMQQPMRV